MSPKRRKQSREPLADHEFWGRWLDAVTPDHIEWACTSPMPSRLEYSAKTVTAGVVRFIVIRTATPCFEARIHHPDLSKKATTRQMFPSEVARWLIDEAAQREMLPEGRVR